MYASNISENGGRYDDGSIKVEWEITHGLPIGSVTFDLK